MNSRYFDFKLIIGLFIIIVLIIGFYGPISEHFHTLNLYYVMLGFLVLLFIIFIKQIKWYFLLRGVVKNGKLAFKSFFTGQFINEIAPMGTGDLAKAYMVRRHSEKSFGFTLSVPYMERIMDIIVLSFIAILSSLLLFFTTISSYVSLIFVLITLLAVGFFLLAIFPKTIAGFIKNILERIERLIPLKLIKKLISKIEMFLLETAKDFQDALKVFKDKKLFISMMFLLAISDWVLEGVCQVFLLNSLGYSIPVLVSIGIVSIPWLVSIPSMIPGGLGIREAVLSLLFTSFGIPFSAALVSVLIYRGLVVLIFGSGSIISLKIKLSQ